MLVATDVTGGDAKMAYLAALIHGILSLADQGSWT
jgi:hypothetical protein